MSKIKKIESGVIEFIAAFTPWLAPLIPAYLVYNNMQDKLGYVFPFPLIGAAAVEFIGLSSVYTTVTFWQWNDRYKSQKAPFWVAFGTGAFYVAIILLVNAGLDIWDGEKWVKIASHALLSLLSVDAAVIIAIRARHATLLSERDDEIELRRKNRENARKAAQQENESKHDTSIVQNDAGNVQALTTGKFICTDCNAEFDSVQKLGAHKRWKHKKEKDGTIATTESV